MDWRIKSKYQLLTWATSRAKEEVVLAAWCNEKLWEKLRLMPEKEAIHILAEKILEAALSNMKCAKGVNND